MSLGIESLIYVDGVAYRCGSQVINYLPKDVWEDAKGKVPISKGRPYLIECILHVRLYDER